MKRLMNLNITKIAALLAIASCFNILQNTASGAHIVNYYAFRSDYNCLLVEDNNIWAGSTDGLVRWDKASNSCQRYTTEDGLPSLWINCLIRDYTGRLWAGTRGGLAWFDGSCWRVSLKGPGVEDLAVDADNNLWAATGNRVYKFDGKEWNYHHLGISVKCLYLDDQNVLWIGTSEGVRQFDGQNWTWYNKSDSLFNKGINVIFEDSSENYWFGTDAGVVRWNGTEGQVFDTTNGLTLNRVTDIKEDQEGHIWVATSGSDCAFRFVGKGGLNEWDGHLWAKYNTTSGLSSNYIREIAFDQKGNPCLATGKGINYWDGQRWQCLLTHKSLNTFDCPIINDLFVDTQGNLWLATGPAFLVTCGRYPWGGLVKYDGTHFTLYNTDDGLPGIDVSSVTGDNQGNLWIGTCLVGGLSRFDGKEFVNFAWDGVLLKIFVDHLDRKWVCGMFGVSVFDDTTWTNYPTIDQEHWMVLDITEDKAGHIWAVDDVGLFSFDGVQWTHVQGLPPDCRVSDISVDRDDHLWIGTDKGLVFYDGSHFVTYTEADGLPSSEITAVDASAFSAKKHQYLLVGTLHDGMGILTEDGWLTISKKEGLISNRVKCFAIGRDSDIWVGTSEGLSRLYGFLTTSVKLEEETPALETHVLESNYPNPFNATTAILYRIAKTDHVELTVFDVLGRKVRLLYHGVQTPGDYRVIWNGKNESGEEVGSGIYLLHLRAGEFTAVRKMCLLR